MNQELLQPKNKYEHQIQVSKQQHEVKLQQLQDQQIKLKWNEYIYKNLTAEQSDKINKLTKSNNRMRQELVKKNNTIKRLQGDLHHYYNKH